MLENRGHNFVENAMILTCAKIQRKILMFGEVGARKVLSGTENYMNIRPAHFVTIRFILENPRFNK